MNAYPGAATPTGEEKIKYGALRNINKITKECYLKEFSVDRSQRL